MYLYLIIQTLLFPADFPIKLELIHQPGSLRHYVHVRPRNLARRSTLRKADTRQSGIPSIKI